MRAEAWGPIDRKYLTALNMRCEQCGGLYVIHTMGGRPDQLILSIHESCTHCGNHTGRVVGFAEDEWPEFIDA